MTATAPWNPQYRAQEEARRVEEAARRRAAESARRRQEALANLAARRMAVPGQHRATADLEFAARPIGRLPGGVVIFERPQTVEADVIEAETARLGESADLELPRPSLTAREVEVLRTWLLLDSKPAVAADLGISLGTVNTHLTRIRAKYADLGRPAPTKAGLVARAVQDELISLEEL
ncbi:putative LuxR family transcriptional regulator [Gordonia araii NBRC 100433]|uniref:Putative LuxR family transcriptional regulator n=1 Tax=Gordonia araii NBRC 100433 TaxID=1073574 RepID=G7H5G9_9ACTN|nr:LuxR C-terminal-related transcriptional regulator [Gordonia araii]NNG95808.1 LuxR family transcriptional regulator [Gordonia araii NBRC 100433]GAB11094.1 putative LuxR family transcriptional regulator [Gordonia araii NBRC 100433]